MKVYLPVVEYANSWEKIKDDFIVNVRIADKVYKSKTDALRQLTLLVNSVVEGYNDESDCVIVSKTVEEKELK